MSERISKRHYREYDRRPRSRSRGRERDELRSPREEGSKSHRRRSESDRIDRGSPSGGSHHYHRGRKRARSQTPSMRKSIRSQSPENSRGRSHQGPSKEDTRSPQPHEHAQKRKRTRDPSRSRSLSSDSSTSSSRSRRKSGGKRMKDKKGRHGERRSKTRHRNEEDVRRSILTGKKIKLKVRKGAADLERDSNREELLQFLNSSY